MERKPVKVGVLQGEGSRPGYEWNVLILDRAYQEAMSFLTEDQYQHLAMQFKELARESDPSHSQVADVKSIEDFFELRDKGGILGKINVRVFFGLETSRKNLFVLGCFKKETNGRTPAGVRIRIRNRWRNLRRKN
jgi:phage-related protein